MLYILGPCTDLVILHRNGTSAQLMESVTQFAMPTQIYNMDNRAPQLQPVPSFGAKLFVVHCPTMASFRSVLFAPHHSVPNYYEYSFLFLIPALHEPDLTDFRLAMQQEFDYHFGYRSSSVALLIAAIDETTDGDAVIRNLARNFNDWFDVTADNIITASREWHTMPLQRIHHLKHTTPKNLWRLKFANVLSAEIHNKTNKTLHDVLIPKYIEAIQIYFNTTLTYSVDELVCQIKVSANSNNGSKQLHIDLCDRYVFKHYAENDDGITGVLLQTQNTSQISDDESSYRFSRRTFVMLVPNWWQKTRMANGMRTNLAEMCVSFAFLLGLVATRRWAAQETFAWLLMDSFGRFLNVPRPENRRIRLPLLLVHCDRWLALLASVWGVLNSVILTGDWFGGALHAVWTPVFSKPHDVLAHPWLPLCFDDTFFLELMLADDRFQFDVRRVRLHQKMDVEHCSEIAAFVQLELTANEKGLQQLRHTGNGSRVFRRITHPSSE